VLFAVVVQRVFFGEITKEKNRTLPDVSTREKWILITMVVVTLWMGIGSVFITRRTAADAQAVIDQVEPQRPYEAAAPARPDQQAARIAPSTTNANSVERPGTR
jgi:NADH:ubiquinone oxidoreductase subunit 4 (subunit M)